MQRINLETAILARKKGYNIPCTHFYNINGKLDCLDDDNKSINADLAPFQYELQEWLRINKGVDISINRAFSFSNCYYYVIINNWDFDNAIMQICVPNRTYEESLENALQKSLNLIKL